MLAETDHLVILADYLGCTLREIEGEGGLICTEVVDVEHEFLGEVFGRAPDHPTNARVNLDALAESTQVN